jgi:hypothetical protein
VRIGVVITCVALAASCGPPQVDPPDGAPPRVLEVFRADESCARPQMGLQYAKTAELCVRYRLDDGPSTPIAGAVIRFSFVRTGGGDPGTATLSADRATTHSDGVARVRVTAGMEERSFRVRAQAEDGASAEFGVAVSKLEFVRLDVALEGPATVTKRRALLYTDRTCAELPPLPAAPPSLFELGGAGSIGTLTFEALVSRDYAVVGRGEDAANHLAAYGCVDVASALVPPGSQVTLPVPLPSVRATVTGSYDLSSQLTLKPALAQAATAPFDALDRCPLSPAQELLDALAADLGAGALATAIAAKRGPADGMGCRPVMAGASPSLDAQLHTLLTPAGAPALMTSAITADLSQIVASFRLASRFDISDAGREQLIGLHTLGTVTLSKGGAQAVTYDVDAAGRPIVAAPNIALGWDGTSLAIASHDFTLGLPDLWRRAVADLALTPRGISPATPRGLWGAIAGAAQRNAKAGCAAVEDLICTSTGAGGCTGPVATSCANALDDLALPLDAAFDAPPGVDFTLEGQAIAFDSAGDLLVDQLKPGTWSCALAQAAPWSGVRK